ncbi:hypothetical protein C0992_002747 [Termitomyces sp. T32_za158]|nr:hypothetical protein C0992_002747 [Termitomyces sp. T32_za158]
MTFQLNNAHITFAASYLQGIAFDHYTTLLQFKPQSPVLSNWQAFVNKFLTKFGVFNTVAKAEDNLFNLQMRPNKRFTTFIICFEKEAYETGWNYNMLWYALRRALPQRIKDILRLALKQPTYQSYKVLVMQNARKQTWQPGTPSNATNPQPPNPALPATPSTQPPFVCILNNNSQTPGPRPPAQLNASDTIKAPEPNPNKPVDPDSPVNDSTFPKDEEALQANHFRSSNKPWIDVPLDVQERRQKEGACILCGEWGHFIGECPKCPAMGHAVWTFEGKECEYQFAEHDPINWTGQNPQNDDVPATVLPLHTTVTSLNTLPTLFPMELSSTFDNRGAMKPQRLTHPILPETPSLSLRNTSSTNNPGHNAQRLATCINGPKPKGPYPSAQLLCLSSRHSQNVPCDPFSLLLKTPFRPLDPARRQTPEPVGLSTSLTSHPGRNLQNDIKKKKKKPCVTPSVHPGTPMWSRG